MKYKLSELAEIKISNVDKKSFDNETKVILCNFTDVYYNWRITPEMTSHFMVASATINEINDFQIEDGDVAITKDSETRDDIGIPTYFDGNFNNLILGYHCALIKPNREKLDGGYLNALLNTNYAKKYFFYNAGGSGQRFTLSLDAIKNLEIDLPNIHHQRLITNILGTLDKKIEINCKKIELLEKQVTLIYYQYFFRKKANGIIKDIVIECPKSSLKVNYVKEKTGNYPFFTSGKAILEYNEYLVEGCNLFLNTGGTADIKIYDGKCSYSTDTWCITSKNGYVQYLYLLLKTIITEIDKKFFEGSGLKHLQKEILLLKKIYIPSLDEIKIVKNIFEITFKRISKLQRENKHLNDIKKLILPILINGQVAIN